jgi:hypothetical protein
MLKVNGRVMIEEIIYGMSGKRWFITLSMTYETLRSKIDHSWEVS